ncbi:hypothetical protein M413DRAFT_219231 [Hebeloma cylindrosporum]|uniref:SEC7 domain-containing protein n=1 Tax=Hebeloma cylindrosporum TaxID=76867 RepID=A0A0C2Z489_HEBCY|nr:hypothetical protein M413DRAFT_219231 [Hebeloma cylindrosporum h7]
MEVGLPRETQQIDRVMEAFAFRYTQCNPNVFISEDHPYILAFSLIMLHTDAFNPSNKRKMTKADYIKNTKLPGIATEVLEVRSPSAFLTLYNLNLQCFFDNIVFAPFIFIEDPVDFNGQPGLIPDVTRSMTVTASTSVLPISNAVASFKMGNKIDPYYLIINNLLGPLRVDVQTHIPLENPFTFRGTAGSWDEQELHQAFVKANVIEVEMPAMNRVSPIFNINPSGSGTPATELHHPNETWSLKLTKVGVLNRKDDMMEGGVKSSNRRWKAWSAILTGSQLLFFRDPAWASALSPNSDSSVELTPTPSNLFRPDESFSLKDTLAVYDLTYTKYNHTLRFLLPSGRQLLLQAADDKDLNEWISRINYASTFKSVGIKMRPLGLSREDVHLTGVAAATSHLHDIQRHSDIARPHSWDSNAPHVLMDMLTGQPNSRPTLHRRVTMAGKSMDFEPDVPVTLEFDGAEQFKATFDQVKADLAASWPSSHNEPWFSEQGDDTVNESPPLSPNSFDSKFSRLPSRSHIIQAKIHDLDSKIMASQTQLDSDVRCVRNIAILTPFQKSTRSKLFSAVQGMAKRVALLRLELEKRKCYRTVLLSDLTSEGRTWHRSKQVALRAAKETLQIRRAHTIPAMTLSLLNDPPSSTDSQFPNTPSSQGRKSSISGSFHSAIDFGLDWHSTDDTNFLTTRCESTTRSFSASTPSLQISRHERDGPENLRRSISVTSSANHIRSEPSKVYESDNVSQSDEEQAEEWNRTRCAHRVSLIRVPSDIRMLKKSIGP